MSVVEAAATDLRFTMVASIEVPIILIARGLGATEAVLEELDPDGECRLRSLRFFSPGTTVQFAIGSPLGGGKVEIQGRIAGYATKGQRFIYHIELGSILPDDAQTAAAFVAERRRQLGDGEPRGTVADAFSRPPLARASIRADADFDLEYRWGKSWRHATAANLSIGGLLMRAHEILVEGMAVDLRFTLPHAVLERCSEDAVLSKLWDPSVRRAAQAMLRRPFKEIGLRARVVCHRAIAGTIGDYGMEFCSIEAAARAEIERFIAAWQFGGTIAPRSYAAGRVF